SCLFVHGTPLKNTGTPLITLRPPPGASSVHLRETWPRTASGAPGRRKGNERFMSITEVRKVARRAGSDARFHADRDGLDARRSARAVGPALPTRIPAVRFQLLQGLPVLRRARLPDTQ